MGAAGGIWAGPIGVGLGIVVGGILGALLSDHTYLEVVGTSDTMTRSFIDRFTYWTGVDETGMALALATEHRANSMFVQRVFASLSHDYSSDADDIALEYVRIARSDPELGRLIQKNLGLRQILIQLLEGGWTSGGEQQAIRWLQALGS